MAAYTKRIEQIALLFTTAVQPGDHRPPGQELQKIPHQVASRSEPTVLAVRTE